MRRRFLTLLLSFLISSADAQTVLTLDAAVEAAVKNSIDLRKSGLDLEAAAYSAERLWAEMFPSISLGGGANYGTNLFTGENQFSADGFGYSVSASAHVSFNAGVPYAMKLTALAYQTQLLSYADARKQLKIQVAKDFYSLIAEKENISVLGAALNLAEGQEARSATAFRNGLINERVNLQSQLAAETARLALIRAETAYAANLRDFLTLLGVEEGAVLEGKIEIAKFDESAEELILFLDKRPDIVSRKQDVERLEIIAKRQQYEKKAPSFSAGVTWSGSGNEFSDRLSGSVSIDVPVEPWIPGTKSHQSLKTAALDVEKARLDLQDAENKAKNEIRSLAANLRSSWQTIETARLQVRVAERVYQVTESGFQQGAVELSALEDARNNMSRARQELLSSESAYKTLTLDLDKAVNR
ncbi:MAG: TolC family protein [Treponema sp.]|jgi:outer membrane protein TolC|nr:TolC family protein [Treponema sp.]